MKVIWVIATVACLFLLGCESKVEEKLKGQVNTSLIFYGVVVDQDGKPLPGVSIQYQVEAYPKDWTFDTRGRPYDLSEVSGISNETGRFELHVTGCMMRMLSVEREGYRHFWEKRTSEGYASVSAFHLIAWGDLWYKSDAEHPAVYVMVKEGVKEVSVLPSRGGFESGGGKRWKLNKPAWPDEPSLPEVKQKPTSP